MNILFEITILILLGIIIWNGIEYNYKQNSSMDYRYIYNSILSYEILNSKDKNSLYYGKSITFDLENKLNIIESSRFYREVESNKKKIEFIKRDLNEFLSETKLEKIKNLFILREKDMMVRVDRRTSFLALILIGITLLIDYDLYSKYLYKLSIFFFIGLIIVVYIVPYLRKRKSRNNIKYIQELIDYIDEEVLED